MRLVGWLIGVLFLLEFVAWIRHELAVPGDTRWRSRGPSDSDADEHRGFARSGRWRETLALIDAARGAV